MIQYLWWGKTQATAPEFNNGRIQVHVKINSWGKTMSHVWKHILFATLRENVYIHTNNVTPIKWALRWYKRHYAAQIKTILSALLHRRFNRCLWIHSNSIMSTGIMWISKMKQLKQATQWRQNNASSSRSEDTKHNHNAGK